MPVKRDEFDGDEEDFVSGSVTSGTSAEGTSAATNAGLPPLPHGLVYGPFGLVVRADLADLKIAEDVLDTRVGVFARKMITGVYAHNEKPLNQDLAKRAWDTHHVYSYNWLEKRFSKENSVGIEAAAKSTTLRTVLNTKYITDAHMVAYSVWDRETGERIENYPRINKSGLTWVEQQGYVVTAGVLIIDIDTPGHKDWSTFDPQFFHEEVHKVFSVPLMKYGILIVSLAGFRVIIPLPHEIPIREYESVMQKALTHFQLHGVLPDMKCGDWTRMSRCPLVNRDFGKVGKDLTAEELATKVALNKQFARVFSDLDDVRRPPFGTPELTISEEEKIRMAHRKNGKARSRGATIEPQQYVPVSELPDNLKEAADAIAVVIRDGKQEGLHDAYLALADVLCQFVSPVIVPAIYEHIVSQTGSKNPHMNIEGARRTVERRLAGETNKGERNLGASHPHILQAAHQLFSRVHLARRAEELKEKVKFYKHDEIKDAIRDAIAEAKGVLTVIQLTAGGGKTHQVLDYIAENSRRSEDYKAVMTSDTNVLAEQSYGDAYHRGVKAQRVYSAPSYQGPNECAYKENAKALSSAGINIYPVMCNDGRNPCKYFETCLAKDRMEGDEDPDVGFGSHKSLQQLLKKLGNDADVFMDEPPNPVKQITIPVKRFEDAVANGKLGFTNKFVDASTPTIQLLIAFASEVGKIGEPTKLKKALDMCLDALDHEIYQRALKLAMVDEGGDGGSASGASSSASGASPASGSIVENVLSCSAVAAEIKDDDDYSDKKAPRSSHKGLPTKKLAHDRMRQQIAFAKHVGQMGAVFSTVRSMAKLSDDDVQVTRVETDEGMALQVDMIDEQLIEMFAGDSRALYTSVALDATADSKIPGYVKATRGKVKVVRIDLDDAHPVRRKVIAYNSSRSRLFNKARMPFWSGGIAEILIRLGKELKDNGSKKVALCTFPVLRMIMQHALDLKMPDMRSAKERWIALGYRESDLEENARRFLALYRVHFPQELKWALYHYGAEKGRNDAMDADTAVTLGDPRPNLDAIEKRCAFLGLDPSTEAERMAAELIEQAGSRLRHVSPFRRAVPEGKSLLMIHFGKILPVSPQWHETSRVDYQLPQQNIMRGMTNEEFVQILAMEGLSVAEAAEKLGIPVSTVKKWTEEEKISDPSDPTGKKKIKTGKLDATRYKWISPANADLIRGKLVTPPDERDVPNPDEDDSEFNEQNELASKLEDLEMRIGYARTKSVEASTPEERDWHKGELKKLLAEMEELTGRESGPVEEPVVYREAAEHQEMVDVWGDDPQPDVRLDSQTEWSEAEWRRQAEINRTASADDDVRHWTDDD